LHSRIIPKYPPLPYTHRDRHRIADHLTIRRSDKPYLLQALHIRQRTILSRGALWHPSPATNSVTCASTTFRCVYHQSGQRYLGTFKSRLRKPSRRKELCIPFLRFTGDGFLKSYAQSQLSVLMGLEYMRKP
jgi:hypothetical protein